MFRPPTDLQLIQNFLIPRMLAGNQPPPDSFKDVHFFDVRPDQLSAQYQPYEGGVWYFYTSLSQKKDASTEVVRRRQDEIGKWTQSDTQTVLLPDGNHTVLLPDGIHPPCKIGTKRTFILSDPAGNRTDWRLHEYRTLWPGFRWENDRMLCKLYKVRG